MLHCARPLAYRLATHNTHRSGLAIDGDKEDRTETLLFKQVGKVAALRKVIYDTKGLDMNKKFLYHTSMSHTYVAGSECFVCGSHRSCSRCTCHDRFVGLVDFIV